MLTINELFVPSERDMMMARESQRQLGGMEFAGGESVTLQVGGKSITVPAGIAVVVAELIRRKAVALMPQKREVLPQEPEELLRGSRPVATRLFSQGGHSEPERGGPPPGAHQ